MHDWCLNVSLCVKIALGDLLWITTIGSNVIQRWWFQWRALANAQMITLVFPWPESAGIPEWSPWQESVDEAMIKTKTIDITGFPCRESVKNRQDPGLRVKRSALAKLRTRRNDLFMHEFFSLLILRITFLHESDTWVTSLQMTKTFNYTFSNGRHERFALQLRDSSSRSSHSQWTSKWKLKCKLYMRKLCDNSV